MQATMQQLVNSHPIASNRCEVVAKGIFDAMKSNKLSPEYLKLNPSHTRFMYVGSTNYTAPQHFAVRLGDRVFEMHLPAQLECPMPSMLTPSIA